MILVAIRLSEKQENFRMKQVLIVLVVLSLGFSNAVKKPGLCSLSHSAKFGACVITCGQDTDCGDSHKCCSTGCGQTCQEPACPSGVSKVDCPPSLCAFSQCPNAPDAFCRIDSCGKCKVEYYNKTTWEEVTCTESDQHLCERMRDFAIANPLPGRYRPTCTKEGKFASFQRRGSVLLCVDEETGIPDFKTATPIGKGDPDCSKKVDKTDCQLAREKALKLPPIGRFVPICKVDGSFKEKQCHGSTGFCWCVDEKGREWFGSRRRGVIECPKSMCPSDTKKVEGCDPMICAAASCPGYEKSEVSCRVNPCGQCKAEFLDKYNRKVSCKTCAVERAKVLGKSARTRVGQFVPECDITGNYESKQCWGSIGFCWCVNQLSGKEITGTRTRGTPNCKPRLLLGAGLGPRTTKAPKRDNEPVCPNGFPMMLCLRPFCQWSSGCAANEKATCRVNPCKMCALEYFDDKNNLVDCKKEMTDCQLKRADAMSSKNIGLQPVGRFIVKCEENGDYSPIQCWGSTGYCWCVDGKTGVEQEMTRVRGRPNCAIKTNETMSVNKTEIKKGRCPIVRPTDTCNNKCDNDEDCSGKEKCCEIGCGKTCRAPAKDVLACPNGLPFLLCLHHCQLSSCPAHPDAQCTVDPCHMCKVEFKYTNGNVVNCSEKLTPCQIQRASSPALLGSFRAECESDGRYKEVQCHGSIGYCWCVDENGQEINNTRQRGKPNCSAVAKKKSLTKCQQMRAKGLATGFLGAKIPQCEDDGSFKQIQTGEGYQWCVDADGIELLGTRVAPGGGTPDCNACSPVMCMMYCQYGFVKDSRGCEICKCAPAPYKPGICPPSKTAGVPPGNVDCTEDLDCGGAMKCCDKKCHFPLNYVKPGYCPRINASDAGDCESKCSRDSDCDDDEKCCAKGCNRECIPPAKRVCPNGVPLVMCLRNMCDQNARCPAHPEATCRMNYCGHCSTEFVLSDGTIADCGDETADKKSNDKVECSGKNKTALFCSPSSCDQVKCAKNPKAKCDVPTISCDCTPSFFNRDGEKVNCLTECQQKRKDVESRPLIFGAFKPRCEEDGRYSRVQCSGSTGYCWCVSDDGTKWPGTSVRGKPDCSDQKRPDVSGVRVQLSFDADYETVKENLDEFKKAFIEHMKSKFGVHHKQIDNIKISSGSIVVNFVLVEHDDGKDVRNVSNNIRNMVIEGEFVFEYGGQTMVAKPESYSSAVKMDIEEEEEQSSSSAVLAITLGVVFGLLAVVLIVGIVCYVRKRSTRDERGMSVNTYDSNIPLHK